MLFRGVSFLILLVNRYVFNMIFRILVCSIEDLLDLFYSNSISSISSINNFNSKVSYSNSSSSNNNSYYSKGFS